MGPTTLSSFVTGPFITAGIDTVFYAASHTVNIISSGPWLPITLQNPFYYNGTSNFLVDVSRNGYTSSITIQQQTVTARSLYGPAGTSSASVQDRLVQFGFDMMPGTNDAGLEGFVNLPDTICEGNKPVTVTLKNHGPNSLSSVKINWKVNNTAQTIYNWSGNLAVNGSTNITIGNYPFLYGTAYNIIAYTSQPNNVNDTVNGNDTIVKAGIVVKQSPAATLSTTNTNICPGDSITISGTLTGSPPWSVVINDGITNNTFSNLQTAVFAINVSPPVTSTFTIVSVTDSTGCTANVGQSVVITVLPNPPATLTPISSTTFCMGDSVILQANTGAGFTFEYRKDGVIQIGNTSTFVAYQQESYTVTITSADGCDSTSAPVVVTVNPLPVVNLGNDTTIGVSQSLTLDAGPGFVSYLWSTGDTTQTIIADSTGIGAGTGTFSVTVTDANTCEGSDGIQITFVTNPGINESQNSNIFTIFPNPARDKINIIIPAAGLPVNLVIFNAVGTKVTAMKCDDHVEINVSDWPRGVYFLNLKNEKVNITEKIFVY